CGRGCGGGKGGISGGRGALKKKQKPDHDSPSRAWALESASRPSRRGEPAGALKEYATGSMNEADRVRALVDFIFFQAEDGIRDWSVTGVQTCALPIQRYASTALSSVICRNAATNVVS